MPYAPEPSSLTNSKSVRVSGPHRERRRAGVDDKVAAHDRERVPRDCLAHRCECLWTADASAPCAKGQGLRIAAESATGDVREGARAEARPQSRSDTMRSRPGQRGLERPAQAESLTGYRESVRVERGPTAHVHRPSERGEKCASSPIRREALSAATLIGKSIATRQGRREEGQMKRKRRNAWAKREQLR